MLNIINTYCLLFSLSMKPSSQFDHFLQVPNITSTKHCISMRPATHFCINKLHFSSPLCNNYICNNKNCECRSLHKTQYQCYSNSTFELCQFININDILRHLNYKIKSIDKEYYEYQVNKVLKMMDVFIEDIKLKRDELAIRMKSDVEIYLNESEWDIMKCFMDSENRDVKQRNFSEFYYSSQQNKKQFAKNIDSSVKQTIQKFVQLSESLLPQNLKRKRTNEKSQNKEFDQRRQAIKKQKFKLQLLCSEQTYIENQKIYTKLLKEDLSNLTQYFTNQPSQKLCFLNKLQLPMLSDLLIQINDSPNQIVLKSPNIFENITGLNLNVSWRINGFQQLRNFLPFFSHLKKLQRLHLEWQTSSTSLNQFLNQIKNLDKLSLFHQNIQYSVLNLIFIKNPNLKYLELGQMGQNQEEVELNWQGFKRLETLIIANQSLTLQLLEKMSLSNLKQLILTNFRFDKESAKIMANGLPYLENLDIYSCYVTDEVISEISKGEFKLKELNISSNQALLLSQQSIESLNLSQQSICLESRITFKQFKDISLKLSHLKKLTFDLNYKINHRHFYSISKMKHIDLNITNIFEDTQAYQFRSQLGTSPYPTNFLACLRNYYFKLINNVKQIEDNRNLSYLNDHYYFLNSKQIKNWKLLREMKNKKHISRENEQID